MEQEALESFREKIEAQIAVIRERLNQHTQCAVETDTNELADEIDRASVEETRRIELHRIEHDKTKIQQLLAALTRIEKGDFGYCESCGEDISYSRLKIRPESAYCIDCQSIDEIRSHQFRAS